MHKNAYLLRWVSRPVALCLACLVGWSNASAEDTSAGTDVIISSHGYNFYGELSYPADFEHFSYVNPDAPKGGEISLGVLGEFDSMHPYSRKGRPAALSSIMYESLLGDGINGTSAPADVYGEYYGLLAERLEYDAGKNWVIFYMRPEARFSDGSPVTAHDIEFSHNLLLDEGLKSYADAVRQRIPKVEVLDDYTIKFYFTPGISRRSLISQVGFVPAFSKKWYEETGAGFDESRLDVSPGSGAYMVDEVDVGRNVVYRRNPDYWGKDLPINRGRYNFDSIRIEYFSDDVAAFEAFKTGVFTMRGESDPRRWATAYDFSRVESGAVVTDALPVGTPPTPDGIVFNLASEPLKDIRVRQALALAFNFEWTNASLQSGLMKQRASFSEGSFAMAQPLPDPEEVAFLESLGDVLPPDMLTEALELPHSSSPDRAFDRRNARRAMALLDEAGWSVGDDGKRRNEAGELLQLSFLFNATQTGTLSAAMENYVGNVKRLGIDIELERVDSAEYELRERDRDYDLVFDSYISFLGTGAGLSQRFGSESASFSLFNPAGVGTPLIDAIIDASLQAETREEERASLRALDRALRREFFMIPVWYKSDTWLAYYDFYEYPEPLPTYGLGRFDFWWANEEKFKALRESGALR